MANILSLAMKINADASGFKLDPVQRALIGLGEAADKISGQFDKFAGDSEAASAAQQRFADQSQALVNALRDGTIGATEFAVEFEKLSAAADAEAAALERAARITAANISPMKAYENATAELVTELNAGRISQETFDAAMAKATAQYVRAANAADKYGNEAKDAAAQGLKFNEFSGILAALPGPLGNVAGRLSGLASAGEGLSRVFSGGLNQGISGIGTAVASVVNPFTLATGAVAGFGAAAAAITQGLIALEDRVEKLGNTADKLGVSFEFVQVLDEAARRSGTSIDAVSSAFGRLQKSVLGVDEESKAAQKALAEIGVTAQELQSLSPEQQYQRIGTALASIEDPARRTAAATALFGRSGSELIPFFENIRGAADDLDRFGSTLTDVQRNNIDQFGASMDRLGVATRSAKEQLLADFAPAATRTTDRLSSAAVVVGAASKGIAAAGSTLLDVSLSLIPGFSALESAGQQLDAQAQAATDSLEATAQAGESIAGAVVDVEGLAKAFEASNKSLDTVIKKCGEFGAAGAEAGLRFQETLQDLQDQANEGELNADEYTRGVANATAEFERQIKVVEEVARQNQRLAEEAKRRADEEAAAVQRLIDSLVEQNRVDNLFGGDSNRAKAADNYNKLLAEAARVEEQLAAARAAGDQNAINAAASRLAVIDSLAAKERDIANGVAKARGEAEKAAAKAAEEAKKRAEQQAQALEQVNEQILAKQQEFNTRQFELELERAKELSTVRAGAVEINDIRDGGISQFFDTLKEDPAVAEARKQRQELEKIRKEIAKLNAEKVDILAGTG